MTAAEGPTAPRSPVEATALPIAVREESIARDDHDHGSNGPDGLPSLCPYLATSDGSWRSSRPVREHRCMAVSPPIPLAAEKQRRLCLVDAHTSCATFGAAMAARAEPIERSPGPSRPIARMTPVILDHGRFDVRMPAWRTDRTSQGVLVSVLGVAFAAILFARPADPAGAGPLVSDPSLRPGGSVEPRASGGADATDPPSTPTEPPAPTASARTTDPPKASATSGTTASPRSTASPEPTTSGATYRVKSGDTLSAIAARYGTTTQVLVRLNDLADPSKLKIGQVLKLP